MTVSETYKLESQVKLLQKLLTQSETQCFELNVIVSKIRELANSNEHDGNFVREKLKEILGDES